MQLRYVLSEGAYLAQRWEGGFQGVNPYFCDDGGRGFFVEVGVDEAVESIVVLRSFRSSVPLEDYRQRVGLAVPLLAEAALGLPITGLPSRPGVA